MNDIIFHYRRIAVTLLAIAARGVAVRHPQFLGLPAEVQGDNGFEVASEWTGDQDFDGVPEASHAEVRVTLTRSGPASPGEDADSSRLAFLSCLCPQFPCAAHVYLEDIRTEQLRRQFVVFRLAPSDPSRVGEVAQSVKDQLEDAGSVLRQCFPKGGSVRLGAATNEGMPDDSSVLDAAGNDGLPAAAVPADMEQTSQDATENDGDGEYGGDMPATAQSLISSAATSWRNSTSSNITSVFNTSQDSLFGTNASKVYTKTIPVPCWTGYEPCGEVAVGTTLTHPYLPSRTLPNKDQIREQNEESRVYMEIVLVVIGLCIIAYAFARVIVPSMRPDYKDFRYLLDPLYQTAYLAKEYTEYLAYHHACLRDEDGVNPDELRPADKQKDEEAWHKHRKESFDINSQAFIAPPNIYRLLAVLHPGVQHVTNYMWYSWVLRAIFTFYMQLYVPCRIMHDTLEKYSCQGIKSPVYFLVNVYDIGALISLFTVFQIFTGKCIQNVATGATANHFVLSMERHETWNGDWSPERVTRNEYFWCATSQFVSILVAMLLHVCFFLKLSTFDGDMLDAAACAVTLYFVFDLEGKIVEATPSLKDQYRRGIIAMTDIQDPPPPAWLLPSAGVACYIIFLTGPVYIFAILSLQWDKNVI